MYRNKLPGTLIFQKIRGAPDSPVQEGCSAPLQYPTKLPLAWRNSAPATLQFPPATFFQFENPESGVQEIEVGIKLRLIGQVLFGYE